MDRNLVAKRANLYHLPNLCDQCSRIDLLNVFKQADTHFSQIGASSGRNIPWTQSSEEGYFVMSFKEPLSQQSQCPLCRFFWRARFGGESTSSYELRAFSSLTCTDYIHSNRLQGLPIKSTQNAFLAVVPSNSIDNHLHRLATEHGAIHRSTMCGASENAEMNGIWGREIGKQIDFSVLRVWMKFCSTNHLGHCVLGKKKQKSTFPAFRVINCAIEPPFVEAVSADQKYVALSYVWGEDSCSPVWPRVVLDSIKVTRELGFNYLWVDRYCIDQDDEEEKQYLISKMAWIYERAEVTIIAASGVDAHHGLPGVESTSRTTQPKIELGNMTLVHTLADPQVLLQDSKWWTRGWTYQEGVLSRRRLVFLEDQVYWECRSMVAHETVRFPLLSTHTKNKLCMVPSMRGGLLGGKAEKYSPFLTKGNDVKAKCAELAQHISNFTRRDLRYETDILSAFEGISSHYSGDNSKLPSYTYRYPTF
ncbi:heterokaryon incompatibility protein domain-containing protein [Trichoderma compactum]